MHRLGSLGSLPDTAATSVLPNTVFRSGLVDLLERSTARRVTIVSAPAGSGKSTLLRVWAEHTAAHQRVAMIAVGRGERDPQRFWLSLLTAARVAGGDLHSATLPSAPEFDQQTVAELLLAALAESGERFVLVIDDFHELQAAGAVEQIEELLGRLPPHVRIVLSGRRDPPLRLHQLRLQGELAEIRSADLAFGAQDGRALLDAAGVQLSEPALSELLARTEGWAAGLRLAALALSGREDSSAFVQAFSGSERTVAEYLLAEVLDRQPEEVRLLLLRTSILDRMNGPLADLLAGTNGAEQTLQALERANAFVVALDPERTWFRYHHLFGDLLRLELRRSRPEEIADLHIRAAHWLAEHGHAVDAIRHAQAAQDWALAARLLTGAHMNMLLDGQHTLISDLLAEFPRPLRESDPALMLVAAFHQLEQGSLVAAARLLALVDATVGTIAADRRATFDVGRAVAGLLLARRRGDFTDVVAHVEMLSRPGEPTHLVAALSDELRALALMNLGIAEMWSLQLDDAELHLEEAAALARRIGRPYLEVGCLAHLGFAAHAHSFARARQRGREAIALAEEHGWGATTVIAQALTAVGGGLLWSAELDESAHLLERASTLLRADGEPATSLLWHLARGNLHAARAEWREALKQYRAAEQSQTLLVTAHGLGAQVCSFRIAMQIKLGQMAEAASAIAEIEADPAPWAELRVALGLFRHAQGDWQGALDAVEPAVNDTLPKIYVFTTVQANMIEAVARVELGDRRASELAVERALALAEADRLVFPFVIMPGHELLRRHPRHMTTHAALLQMILDVLGGAAVASPDHPVAGPSEPLSASERRVLGYLPSNLTGVEIADELVVSVNTVRTHTRHLYAKLGAHNRSEAVEIARRMGLLGRGSR